MIEAQKPTKTEVWKEELQKNRQIRVYNNEQINNFKNHNQELYDRADEIKILMKEELGL